MQRLLKPCVVKYKDTATKAYLHLNAFLNSVVESRRAYGSEYYLTYSESAMRTAPYIIFTLSSPIDSSFTWLLFNIGGVPDATAIPTEDNTIHFNTPRLSPAFIIAGVDKREKVTQPNVTSEVSDEIWKTMTFHQKLMVWSHIKALRVNTTSSLIGYWFRELFSSPDVGDSPLWGGEIIREIITTIPTYHIPMPRIRKNLPIRSTRIDKLGSFLKVPLSMAPIIGEFVEVTGDYKFERGSLFVIIQINDITELWPVVRLFNRDRNKLEIELGIVGDNDPEVDDQSDSFDMEIESKNGRWTITKRYSDDRQRETDIGMYLPPPVFFRPRTTWDGISSLYLREEFTPSMITGVISLNSVVSDIDSRFHNAGRIHRGDTSFIVGNEKDVRNGYFYTMMALSPTVRAIVQMALTVGETSSIPLMTERAISPYFSLLWEYISLGKNAFVEGVNISKPSNDEEFLEYISLWKDIAYFGIPIDTPFVEGYLKVILSAAYRYLLNDDDTIKAIVTILKEIPRDVFLRVNAPIIHTSEYLKQGRLGYFDIILSTIFKPYIPHIVTTYPYSMYKVIPRGEAKVGDIVVFWNRAGRDERISTTHRINEIDPDDAIICPRGRGITYAFWSNNSYEIRTLIGSESIDRMTGITVLRPPKKVPSLLQ